MYLMLVLVVTGTACLDLNVDEVILRSGGRVHSFVPREERLTPSGLIGTTERGIHVTLPNSEVLDTVHESPAMREYRRIAPQYGDSFEAQWELAKWCLAQSLMRQREIHLRRILTLEPGRAVVQVALGR